MRTHATQLSFVDGWLLALSAAACLGLVTGCSGSGTAATLKVTGTVTYQGKPVADASVTFTPEKGRPATGVTDAAGKFTLTTFTPNDGAVPGVHKVSIAPNASKIPPMPESPEAAAKASSDKPPFPARYGNPAQSGFTAEVKQGAKNEFPFAMVE